MAAAAVAATALACYHCGALFYFISFRFLSSPYFLSRSPPTELSSWGVMFAQVARESLVITVLVRSLSVAVLSHDFYPNSPGTGSCCCCCCCWDGNGGGTSLWALHYFRLWWSSSSSLFLLCLYLLNFGQMQHLSVYVCDYTRLPIILVFFFHFVRLFFLRLMSAYRRWRSVSTLTN